MSKGGSKSQTVSSEPPKYLKPFLEGSITEAKNIYDQGVRPIYGGQTYAPMNDIQKQSLDQTLALSQAGNPAVTAAQSSLENILGTPSGQNPYLDQMLEQLSRKTNATVAGNFNAAGRYGSGSHAGTAAREISKETLPLLFDQFNKDQNLKLSASSLAPSIAQYGFDNINRAAAVGDTYQQYDQAAIDDEIAKFDWNQGGGGEAALLDEYLARLYGNPLSQYGSQKTNAQSGGGIASTIGGITSGLGAIGGLGTGLGSFLGGGSALAGAMGGTAGTLGSIASALAIFSDRRLKENIKLVGQENGFNLYEYNYIGKPQKWIGVMADEVEQVRPDAVEEVEGYKRVFYGKIGLMPRLASSGEMDEAMPCASRGGAVESAGIGNMKEGTNA